MNYVHRICKIILNTVLLLGLFISSVIPFAKVSAETITVTTFDDVIDDDGDCSLREAIYAASLDHSYHDCEVVSSADTIILPAGTYTLESTLTDITSEIVINGEGAETTTIEASDCNPITLLPESCDPATYNIFNVLSSGSLTVDGVTLQHGNKNCGETGAIYNEGNLELINCTLRDNQAPKAGGLYNASSGTINIIDSTLSGNAASFYDSGGVFNAGIINLTNSTIINNNALDDGGGLFNATTGTLTVVKSTISNNDSTEGFGGGIYNAGSLSITNSDLSGNWAFRDGGGFYNTGSASILKTTLSDNSSNLDGGGIYNRNDGHLIIDTSPFVENYSFSTDGGGIYNNGNASIINSAFSGNYADANGGGIYNDINGSINFTSCTINANDASIHGGGISNYGSLEITNSTFSGNSTSTDGGGIYNDGSLGLESCTFSANTAAGVGGGIYIDDSGSMDISNTILAYSTNYDCVSTGIIGVDRHNIIEQNGPIKEGLNCGENSLTSDPLLEKVLADNGGPTKTHALQKGSPAIDAGYLKAYPAIDQRSMPRPQGSGPDIGAFEFRLNNVAPEFTSRGKTSAVVGELYTYNITAGDADGDRLWITAPIVPDWLSLTDNGDGTATLTGTPGGSDIGDHHVRLIVEDVMNGGTAQDFYITVDKPPIADFTASPTNGEAPLAVTFTNQTTGGYRSCSWDFGDFYTSTNCNPEHIFQVPGHFNISLTVNGPWGLSETKKISYIVTSGDSENLIANFWGTPLNGEAPLTVTFLNQSMGNYSSLTWDFGDGATINNSPTPQHTYQNPGKYTVTLTVSGDGKTDKEVKTNYVTVGMEPETLDVDFSAVPTSGQVPLAVEFYNESAGSYDICTWDFGDGNGCTFCNNFTHTYQAAGIYTVTLTVSGDGGEDSETKTDYITVSTEPVQLEADFSALPTNGQAPLEVTFSNQTTGAFNKCLWDFGDGTTSIHCPSPQHTYQAAGTYTVTLTVDDGAGGTDDEIKVDYITVLEGEVSIYLPLILR